MGEWKKCKLKDICKTNASSYSSNDNYSFVNYLDTGNITQNVIDEVQFIDIEKDKLPSRAKRKVKYNSILYSTVRPNQLHYGIIKEQPENFLVSTGFTVIDVDEKMADADFIYYYLTQYEVTESMQAIGEQSTSAYPSIKASDLEDLDIRLPTLEEQKKIASFLKSLDEKITINSDINNNLEQQAQAIYLDNFVNNNSPTFVLGKLSDLITVKYGKDHKKLADGIYPVYGSGGIMRYVEKPIYELESVLIPRKGSLNNVMYVNEPFWSVDTMFYTEMKKPNIAKFIYHFVKSKDLASLNAGSAVPSMTTDILNAMVLYIPDDKSFENFENMVSPLYSKMALNDIEVKKLSALRDTLLPKLMSGTLNVLDIDI